MTVTARQPVAERRLVTVVFADIVGFTSLSETRDPEDMQELMDRYFAFATEVIGKTGGHVEKFIGDAVAAMWGAPVAHEDDAERAVRAALELVGSVSSIDPALELRAGVLTGELAITLGSWTEGKVVGDIVNTAARLQSVAPPGRVLVGESTRLAAARSIFFEEAGSHTLKGKAAPLRTWLAVGIGSGAHDGGRPDAPAVPFVGRGSELRLVRDRLEATFATRQAQLLILTGPPGIGKSRLARAIELDVVASGMPVWWHHGRAPAYLDGVAFWALGEMVRERAGLAEADSPAATQAKVAEMLATHVPDEGERRWIEPAMLTLLGVTGTAAAPAPDELFAAWRTFFERLSDARPVVLAFEDLHRADPGLLDFVEQILEWSADRPIFVLGLARPELLESRPDWGRRRNTTTVVLQPLSDASLRELVDSAVSGLAPQLTDRIVDRARGVPLYAIETLRMLEARGDLRRDGGRLVAVHQPSSLAIPDTLTALVGARLDALDPDDRSLVQHAAVLGRAFSVGALAALSGRPADEVRARLGVLADREIVAEVVDRRSPERGQFTFRQPLTQEVAYRTLTRRDRRERHLAAARYLERFASDELAGALAGHYLAAFESGDGAPGSIDTGTDARRALIRAAERASSLGSPLDALSLLERAMSIDAPAEDAAGLPERAAREALAAGQYSRADELARQALSLATATDRMAIARAVDLQSAALRSMLRSEEAEAMIVSFLATADDLVGTDEHAALAVRVSHLRSLAHDHDAAIRWADSALVEAERHDLVRAVAAALNAKGSALGYEGRGYEAMSLLRGAYAIAEANGLNEEMLGALTNLSDALIARDPHAALETARTGVALVRRLGRLDYLANVSMNGMYPAFRTGDWDWAIAEGAALEAAAASEEDRAVGIFGPLPVFAARGIDVSARAAEATAAVAGGTDNQMAAFVEDRRGTIALAIGDLDEAYERCRRAGEMIAWLTPLAYGNAARAAVWQRDESRARAMLDGIRASTHGPAIAAGTKTIEAALAGLAGDVTALAAYRAALEMWHDLRLPVDEALTAIDMVTVLGPDGRDAQAIARKARAMLNDLGAAHWLSRLDATMDGTRRSARRIERRSVGRR